MKEPALREPGLTVLSEVVVGERGKVVQIDGMDGISLRLLEMGLTPGASFVLLGTAPLGDPLELEIRGYRLSVRKSEAARVQVDVTSSPVTMPVDSH